MDNLEHTRLRDTGPLGHSRGADTFFQRRKSPPSVFRGWPHRSQRIFRTSELIRFAEVLGAIGLVVPPLVGILPVLSPIAGIALAVLMAGAVATHLRRKETPTPALVLAILALAAAVLGFLTVA